MINLYVKKLWSLDPDEYKYIPLDMAIMYYSRYLYTAHATRRNIKSFEEWLDTEI